MGINNNEIDDKAVEFLRTYQNQSIEFRDEVFSEMCNENIITTKYHPIL